MECLDREGILHEGQTGCMVNISCIDNVFMLNELVQGRLRENRHTYAFFLDVQKVHVCNIVWRDG